MKAIIIDTTHAIDPKIHRKRETVDAMHRSNVIQNQGDSFRCLRKTPKGGIKMQASTSTITAVPPPPAGI